MAKRISITISEDLYVQLIGIKNVRKSFNISRACQQGLKEAIRKELQKMRQETVKREKLFMEKVWALRKSLKELEAEYHEIKKELEEQGLEMEPEMKKLFE